CFLTRRYGLQIIFDYVMSLSKINRSPWRCLALPLLLFSAVAFQNSATSPLGTWRRLSETPVLAPRGNGWESAGTFTPAVVARRGKIVMLYRAQDKAGTSRLGYAESKDGVHFTRRAEPVPSPSEPYEE